MSNDIDKTADAVDEESASFVDYSLPPAAKILPPAKYKLWIIVFVLVYFASWVSAEAGLKQALRFRGWLSPEAGFFLLLAIIVFVLVYATMDLMIACLTFPCNGKAYGIGAWLKQPRAQWMYSHENIMLEILARVVHILEEGFSMFDAPPKTNPDSNNNNQQQQFECSNRTCHRTLKIEHRIKPDKVDDYKKWVRRIRQAVYERNGLLGTDSTGIHKEWDEEDGTQSPVSSSSADDHSTEQSPQLHVIHAKFANVGYLNEWMLSPRRKALMDALEPMLVEPDVVQILRNRHLPDAFSDLLTRQGSACPKSPPKKWKVWWLTVVALFLTHKWTNSFIPYYFDFWGLTEANDERLERLVFTFISTSF